MPEEKCDCNGMEFLCNRWVFTGSCYHRYTRNAQERLAQAVKRRREESDE